ncbi:MAG: hypothetical protein M0R80_27665 [Proteobacteria bacterium]|jgi:hypothetical protein|nr:hypothetical protein [Pseudomonadota bacterium]
MATTKIAKGELPNWLKVAIDHQLEVELDLIIEDAKKRLDGKRDEILARAMVKVSESVSYQDLGHEIRITSLKSEKEER